MKKENALYACKNDGWYYIPNIAFYKVAMSNYGTAQFKLYTSVQVHAFACTFNTCKTSKTGVCMHCCMRFWRAYAG